MHKYTWDEYYEKICDWSTSTQIKHISDLTSYGPPDEITEVASDFFDEKAASRLVKKALDAGAHFTADNLSDLSDSINRETLCRVVRSVTGPLTPQQLQDLACCLDEEPLQILLRNNVQCAYPPDTVMAVADDVDEEALRQLVLHADGCFSAEQLATLRDDDLDGKTLEVLVKKALAQGIRFPAGEMEAWSYAELSKQTLEKMALSASGTYTEDQIASLYPQLPESVCKKIFQKYHPPAYDGAFDDDAEVPEAPPRKPGLLSALLSFWAGAKLSSTLWDKKDHFRD